MSAKVWAVYIRRSDKREGDADVSDEVQEEAGRSRVPEGAPVVVYKDSGGNNSGYSDERPAYQRLLADLRADRLAGIAALNQSRLNRNGENDLRLLRLCAEHGVRLAVGDGLDHGTTVGKMVYGINAVVSQSDRDRMSDYQKAAAAKTFKDGRTWGRPPFGYRLDHDHRGKPVYPLSIDPEAQAAVVRVFQLLASVSYSAAADVLNREGLPHGSSDRPWTSSTVKDIYRRRDFYRGKVLKKRGLVVNDGLHPALVSEDQYRDAVAGVESRKRTRAHKTRAKRLYLLSGLVYCQCGAAMRGTTTLARGKEWRYLVCPVAEKRTNAYDRDGNLIVCHNKRVPAEPAERAVVEWLQDAALPAEAVDALSDELRRLLSLPTQGSSDRERQRLETRLSNLADLFSWGDLSEVDYRRQRDEARAALAALPPEDADKVVTFDQYRGVVQSLGDELAVASPERIRDLIALLVERVDTADQRVVGAVPVGPALPFLSLLCESPRADAGVVAQRRPLDWYVEVASA